MLYAPRNAHGACSQTVRGYQPAAVLADGFAVDRAAVRSAQAYGPSRTQVKESGKNSLVKFFAPWCV
jgi:hypothetical protein